jgi:hypothetical protein
MKRIVEYELDVDELGRLNGELEKKGRYKIHMYGRSDKGTIDDGTSINFDECSRFSVYELSEDRKSAILRVKDSQLADLIDSVLPKISS